MKSKRLPLSGALLAMTVGVLVSAALAGVLPAAPWGGSSAEARTAVLEAGVLTPIEGGGVAGATGPASPALVSGPSAINFQGRLTDPGTGNAIANGSYSMTFRVFAVDAGGTALWTETASVSVAAGVFNHQLGTVADFPSDLFSDNPRFLEVQVDTDPAMTPRLAFLSVPYAFHADTSDLAADAADINCTGCVNPSDVEFNYAASASQNGPASDVACLAPAGCVSGNEIVDGQVGSTDVADNSIVSADVNDGTITGSDISDGTVASADITDNSIVGADILNGTIAGLDITDEGITSGDILNGTITTTDIANSAVLSINIADGTVTSADIADGTVTGTDIANNSVLVDDVNFPYAGSSSAGGPASDVVCDGNLFATCVHGVDIVDGTVTSTDIANSTLVSLDIVDGTIVSADIADGTIVSADIADGTIASADIGDGTIASADIADGTIFTPDIAFDGILPSRVGFNYAGSATKGGPATDLACVNCIVTEEIADGTITTADIADGTIFTPDIAMDGILPSRVGFNYAGSASKGGAASDLSCVNCIVTGEITDGTIVSADIADGTVTGADITDATVASIDVADNSLVASDVNISYAAGAGENGVALNSQLLDSLDSTQFLRSDTGGTVSNSVNFANGVVTVGTSTGLQYDNAGVDYGLRLNNNGGEGDQYIYFYDGASATGQSLQWCEACNVGLGEFQFSRLLTAPHFRASGSISGDFIGANTLKVDTLSAAGATALCRNGSNQIATCSSSLRYKDDVAALAVDGDKVLALRPVTFNWKDSGDPGIGLVAEEVEKLVPELITYDDKGEVEGVQYDKLSVYLLELLKEHENELAQLKAESGDVAPQAPESSQNLGAQEIALVLAAAIGAAVVISSVMTLLLVRVSRRRDGAHS